MLKVIFTGTSEFAVPSLEALIASPHDIMAVVTQPDKPKGRGRGVQTSPVKEVAVAHSIPVLQPEKIGSSGAIEEIKSFGAIGTMIVVAYGQKIPKAILEWPKYGIINVHGSILPKYRGAAPIQHAIMAGEKETGVTTMLMDEGLDTGDILLQESIDISQNENAGELSRRLSLLGAGLLMKTLEGIEFGTIVSTPQDNELATLAKSLPREAGFIDWSLPADVIVNRIRGCTPKPGAFTKYGDNLVKIWSAKVKNAEDNSGEYGEVISIDNGGITVAAGSGAVQLIDVQPESRKRMSAADFGRGSKIKVGSRFTVRISMD